MMKQPVLLTVIGFALLGILFSCSKSKNNAAVVPKTNTQLITQSVWKYDTAGIDANNDGTIDGALPAGYIQNCQRDNLLTFNSDSTGTIDEGPTKCNSTDPQTTSFTWAFNSSQSVITSSSPIFAGVGGDFTIHSLTETALHLTKMVNVSGLTVNLAIYLKH